MRCFGTCKDRIHVLHRRRNSRQLGGQDCSEVILYLTKTWSVAVCGVKGVEVGDLSCGVQNPKGLEESQRRMMLL